MIARELLGAGPSPLSAPSARTCACSHEFDGQDRRGEPGGPWGRLRNLRQSSCAYGIRGLSSVRTSARTKRSAALGSVSRTVTGLGERKPGQREGDVEDGGEEAALSLFRADGEPVDGARCRITRWRRAVRDCRQEREPISSGRVTFLYPRDFESLFIDGALAKRRYAVVWEARLRSRRTGVME